MNKTPEKLTDGLKKPQSKNEGKRRLTQIAALVAFGASVGLAAQVNAAPNVEPRKVSKKVDAKDLKVKRNVDARKVKKVDVKKIEVEKVNEVDPRFDPGSGPGKPPPP